MEGLVNKMKAIHKSPTRVLFPESGSSPPSGLGSHSTNGSAASSILLNKRFTLPFLALLAVLTVGLLFMLPGSPLHAQEAMTEVEYAENGMDPAATFTAIDPEGRMVYWSLLMDATQDQDIDGDGTNDVADPDIADASDFTITSVGGAAHPQLQVPPGLRGPGRRSLRCRRGCRDQHVQGGGGRIR